jgi:hypothetical protein
VTDAKKAVKTAFDAALETMDRSTYPSVSPFHQMDASDAGIAEALEDFATDVTVARDEFAKATGLTVPHTSEIVLEGRAFGEFVKVRDATVKALQEQDAQGALDGMTRLAGVTMAAVSDYKTPQMA